MSYRYEEKRNGSIYVYEISSYWDKEKKQSRQRRVYLGKKNQSTGKLEAKLNKHPIGSVGVGGVHLLREISKQLNLVKVLKKVFPKEYEKVLYLSFFKVIRGEAYYLYPYWCQESFVSSKNCLNSPDISNFLLSIGLDEQRVERFFMEWIGVHRESSRVFMFDITSISSYGVENEFLERGYNRDGESLDQVNLGVLSQSKEGLGKGSSSLPLGYRLYPGSITDVVSLRSVLQLAKEYDLDLKCFVLDKGFYSQENIKDLNREASSYIVPMSFSTSLSHALLGSVSKELDSIPSSFVFRGQVYSYCKREIKIGKTRCMAHIYLDEKRRVSKKNEMLLKLDCFERRFSKKKFRTKKECDECIAETLKSAKKRFTVVKKKGGFFISKDLDYIKKQMRKMGVLILLTDCDQKLSKDEILELYRNKDSIEKIFLSFKHDINEKRTRTHSLQTMRGSLFINFIALILISHINNVMKEKNLYKKFSKTEVYKILDKLKFYKLATGQTRLGELSGKQKSLYKAFNVTREIPHSFKL